MTDGMCRWDDQTPRRLVKKTESENEMELEEYRVGKWENAYQLGYVSSYQANEKCE